MSKEKLKSIVQSVYPEAHTKKHWNGHSICFFQFGVEVVTGCKTEKQCWEQAAAIVEKDLLEAKGKAKKADPNCYCEQSENGLFYLIVNKKKHINGYATEGLAYICSV